MMFLEAIAKAIEVMAREYSGLTDEVDRRAMRRQISVCIRNATDHPSIAGRIEASQAARTLATERGIDLSKMTWANQTGKQFDPGRKLFAYEHMVPVKSLMYAVIADPSSALRVLQSARLVWVTRAENDRLTELGYAHERADPQKCYEEAGIKL